MKMKSRVSHSEADVENFLPRIIRFAVDFSESDFGAEVVLAPETVTS